MGTYAMTGGATGIGAAVKQRLIGEGHRVIVVDIKEADIVRNLFSAPVQDSVRQSWPILLE